VTLPLVSAVMATYDGERFVRAAVESVLAQDYGALEVIVCDDGSRDGTLDVLRAFGARIRLIEQENAGVSVARNRAARVATGEFIAFLDQDDLWDVRLLSTQVPRLLEHPEWGFVYADSAIVDADGRARGRRGQHLTYAEGDVFRALLSGNFVPLETLVMRADVLRELGGFRVDLRYLEDFDLCLRAARARPVGFTSRVLASYRIHDSNLTHQMHEIVREYALLLDELATDATDAPLSPGDAAVVEHERRRRHGELAWYALRRADVEEADRWLAREPAALRPAKLRILRALCGVLPHGLYARLVALLPRPKLYGV